MKKEDYAAHIRHCCAIHGCKYQNEDCPVALEEVKQDYPCRDCGDENIKSVQEVQDYLDLLDAVKLSQSEGRKEVCVNTETLYKILFN